MLFALLISGLAGLSTGIGGLAVLFFRRPGERMMSFSMGFAAGVMMTVSLSDMLPHTVETYCQTMPVTTAALDQSVPDGNGGGDAAGTLHSVGE